MLTNKSQHAGLTLVELLIVVAVVAILAGLAYPSYQNHITRTRFADAKVMLLQIMQQQRKHFTDNNTYTDDLKDLGYDESTDVVSDNEFYLITASACDGDITQCVILTAEPAFGGVGEPDITYNSQNIKTPTDAW